MRSRVPCLVARIHGVSRPRDCQPSRGEEATTLPMPESPIAEVVVALSMPDLSQDRKAAVNAAPITAQPPSFLALEVVPRLGEKKPPPFHA
ncbi:hypothetical protein BHE74_00033290 [Ensete ventricosum]|nr:hypothetical protein BHE74_00033290 [Ensete ventricosum]RZS25841.1 hypothetical protein BHM03_00059103 [Ensete ventricosum]